jgi:hypothetical protein
LNPSEINSIPISNINLVRDDITQVRTGVAKIDAWMNKTDELKVLERQRKATEACQKCMSDLYITDPHQDKERIEEDKGGLLRNSYYWILENPEFQQWRVDPDSRLLWIKGDPGKGKTMLLCGVIDELSKSIANTVNIAFFFCQATQDHLKNATAILRSLIYMLVKQQPLFISYLHEIYKDGKQCFEGVNAWVALRAMLNKMLADVQLKKTYIIIDALDECVQEDLPKLLEFIRQNSSVSPRVKWMVSSRNWPQIEGILDLAEQKVKLCLELNADSISEAVAAFIQYKVQELVQRKKYDQETEHTVQAYLLKNAHDTFLWVALVCQNLMDFKATTNRHAVSKLYSFPPGLDSLYSRMMEQIQDSDDSDLCKRVLAIVATISRPLTLQELMALRMLQEVEDLKSLREIIALCGSFLIIRDETVYFVHQSAKDFLLDKASSEVFPAGIGQIHYQIFSQSLEGLTRTLRRDMCDLYAPGLPIDQFHIPDTSLLASIRYSCIYWVDHLYEAVSADIQSNDLEDEGTVHIFLNKKYLYWLEALSLFHKMSDGVMAVRKLETLVSSTLRGLLKVYNLTK